MMEQTPLTFDNWEQETRALRERLAEERKALIRNVEEYTNQLAGVEARIGKLDVALGDAIEVELPVEAPKRDRGILVVVKGSVLPYLDGWTLETVVEAVHKIKPGAKSSSVRGALSRLVKQDLVTTAGDRGSRLYYRAEAEERKPGPLVESVVPKIPPLSTAFAEKSEEPPRGLGGVVNLAKESGPLVDAQEAEKTSLKATPVKGKMLFGDAQRPDHM